ncbi:MAG: transcriptional [Planctomycetota bacterium]|nr:MAG: transcriptional [Planctomycetota bacterium]
MIIDESKQDTKLPAIMNAAVRLFVESGVASTTIRDIAKAAKVAEGTLYRHYDSKEELARDILQKNLATFSEFMERKAREKSTLPGRLEGLARAFAEAYEENQDLARFILFSHAAEMERLPKSMRLPRHVVHDILKEAVAARELPAGADLDLLQALIIGSCSRLLLAKAYGEVKGDLRDKAPEVGRRLARLVEGK